MSRRFEIQLDGMDIDMVRQLATRLRAEAMQIRSSVARINARVESMAWIGRDQVRFAARWHHEEAPSMLYLASTLEQAARDASAYAELQSWASRA